jgi:hypothetical protein
MDDGTVHVAPYPSCVVAKLLPTLALHRYFAAEGVPYLLGFDNTGWFIPELDRVGFLAFMDLRAHRVAFVEEDNGYLPDIRDATFQVVEECDARVLDWDLHSGNWGLFRNYWIPFDPICGEDLMYGRTRSYTEGKLIELAKGAIHAES